MRINPRAQVGVVLLLCAGCVARGTAPPQPAPRQAYWPSQAGAAQSPFQAPTQPIGYAPLIQSATAARVIRADSPRGLGPQHLGMPLDASFTPMIGAGAIPLFPQAGPPLVMTVNEMRHDQELVTTIEQLNASVHYLVYNGDVGIAQTKRYGIYRAVQLRQVYELRDNTPMSAPPPGAVYYPWRIYVGYAYTEAFEGDATTFTADIGAKFLKWGAEAGVERTKNNLQSRVSGRGLVPRTGQAIFAHGPAEIVQNYSTDGPPVPIVVEYRQIPNTRTTDGAILWVQPKIVEIRFTTMNVGAAGSGFRSVSNWNMQAQCFINGAPTEPPVGVLQQQVSDGGARVGVQFVRRVAANDSDTVECITSGTYSRFTGSLPLGRGTTGRIPVATLGTVSGSIEGRDPNTAYAIGWSATRVQP